MNKEQKIQEWVIVNYDTKNLPTDDTVFYNLILKGNKYRCKVSLYYLKTAYNFEILEKYQIEK